MKARLSVMLVLALLCGCASRQGIKVIHASDAERAAWAKPSGSFQSAEPLLAHIEGYAGSKVTLELWRDPNMLVRRSSFTIPASKTYRSEEGYLFDPRFKTGDVVPVEQHTFYRTRTDRLVRMPSLGPGIYELRLAADDGRKQSVKFTVQARP